jgi:hypothetical protein
MDESYEVLDSAHAQLRSFRNILLLSAAVITALVVITIVFVHRDPTVMPFCFPNEIVIDSEPVVTEAVGQNCPTASATTGPSGDDIMMVALLGALGGALAASASIRNLKGTSTAYDVPVALAFLKLPLGAFTAILGLVAIRGDFVPGLSVLDSQEQILAYALIFGFAQQILTRLLDQRAQTLVEELPGGTAVKQPPTTARPGAPVAGTEPSEAKVQPPETGALADLPYQDVEVVSSEKPVDAEPEDDNETLAPVVAEDEVAITDPMADQGDQLQEDEIPSDPEVPPDDVPTQRR